jgi:hypothetical protein
MRRKKKGRRGGRKKKRKQPWLRSDPGFVAGWSDASSKVDGEVRQALISMIILGAWSIWNLS